MKNQISKLIALLFFACSTALAQNESKTFDPQPVLVTFVGEWTGQATAYFPRDSSKTTRLESIQAVGKKILKDTYVEIKSSWTQEDGSTRELLELLNYPVRKDSFQVLYLYDNWPGRVDYPLSYNEETRTFKGYDTFIARGGIPAEEKVEWVISKDGNEIRGTEYNHLSTDPDGYWPKTFEYVLRRKE
ncbi:MAG: hypothetical protein R8N23_08525 [Reichenbachiella sp.]|uniref:hypothetical protein n=1 Tax=Reichenbachiella sp. TaxID=2184521 RepID=UPI0029672C74|nr:hypothetical protein [Reichenbachiella sp.]MDW3209897.1 hypothetical protein [Reichenbachiella sp.]